jgi:predicted glycosyltransferase involved in capsule biosynthesis
MHKYDLSDCSIIIPFHADCPERIEHLLFQLRYFSKFFIHYELIIVEQGIKPALHFPQSPGLRTEFIVSEEEFSTTRISNLGASLVKTPFFCKCDTDALIHPKAFFDALQTLKVNPSISVLLPYNGISFTLKGASKEELMRSLDFETLPFVLPEENCFFDSPCISLKSDASVGLIHFFRTATFKTLGGYNEEFIGWGYEDNEILIRFQTLGHPSEMLKNYNAFHLDHPRTEGSKFQLLQNIYRLNLVEAMSAQQLKDYLKTWTRF